MRQLGLIIGKWKMRRIIHLEIFWVDAGRAPGSGAFSAMSSGEDGVDGRNGVFRGLSSGNFRIGDKPGVGQFSYCLVPNEHLSSR